MRGPAGRCPNCSAPIRFRWSGAVQTTCESCRSVVVRHDLDVETIGEVSQIPPDSSPIQLGTAGRLDGRAFTVVGRIAYAYEDGGWNEWHLVFEDGTSGWLSDAQAEYAVTSLVTPATALPPADRVDVGAPYYWNGHALQVASITGARYVGVEGELPFEYWGRGEIRFADLRSHDATFGTIDYSESPPLLFVGRSIDYDDLALQNVRTLEATEVGGVRGFNCPNCGAAVERRALTHAVAVACTSCGAILDPRDPNLVVLQEAGRRERVVPTIPLGTRGTWHGHPFDVIGFQRRSITVDDARYHWDEYVLFNPYQGFRYLSVYEGHWNDIRTVPAIPEVVGRRQRPRVRLDGRTYQHFQSAVATTDVVLGEFPWRVRAGDTARTADFIDPPFMLSSETTDGETTWSRGTYTPGREVWRAFGLEGSPPPTVGVFANQPSHYGQRLMRTVAIVAVLLVLLVLLVLGRMVTADREQAFAGSYTWDRAKAQADSAFVTPTFTLREPGTVEITVQTTLLNSWIAFDLALIDLGTGTAYNVAEEVSYYAGRDSDGTWTEGSQRGRVLLPRMEAGEYYLRVEPEADPALQRHVYSITVRRDVPSLTPYGVAALLLLVPPVWLVVRLLSFEHRRLQESDYGG